MKKNNEQYAKAVMSMFYSVMQAETKEARKLYALALKSTIDRYVEEKNSAEDNTVTQQ